MAIRIPATRKRVNAIVFRSPNKKKLGASEDTKIKYPPKASNNKAESKVSFLSKDTTINKI